MKTDHSLSSSQNSELNLGWTSMPAYGEVMSQLVGTAHTDVASTVKLASKDVLVSFWSRLSNLK